MSYSKSRPPHHHAYNHNRNKQHPHPHPHKNHNYNNNHNVRRLSSAAASSKSDGRMTALTAFARDIPRLPKIKRFPSIDDEIAAIEQQGMNAMTSHNIASVVNSTTHKSSSFLADILWEDDALNVIDSSPPHHLVTAAKQRISPCKVRRVRSSRHSTKLTPFTSMKQLQSHRFHLAELFQNDADTKKDLRDCFEKVPAYFFDAEYQALPSRKADDSCSENEHEHDDDGHEHKSSHQKRQSNLLMQLKDCQNHKILNKQQRLAHYLDLVEVNLLKQICIESESFFAGLRNIETLQTDVCDILGTIEQLRTSLQRMEQYEVMSWSKVMSLAIRQRNTKQLLEVLLHLHNLHIMQRRANELVTRQEYTQAVRVVLECRLIVQRYQQRVPVIDKFEVKLQRLQTTIAIKLVYEIVDASIAVHEGAKHEKRKRADARRSSRSQTNAMGMNGLNDVDGTHNAEEDKEAKMSLLEQNIKSCILLQDASKSAQSIHNALQTKFECKMQEVCGDANAHNNNMEIFVASIDEHSQYIAVLQSVFFWAEVVVESLQSICELFAALLSSTKDDSLDAYQRNSTTLRKSLCTNILSVCSLLLNARARKNRSMSMHQLKSVFAKTLGFLQNIEVITNDTRYDIRGLLLSQGQSFLDQFHEQRVARLNVALDGDAWKPVKVPVEVQSRVEQLQSGPTSTSTSTSTKNHSGSSGGGGGGGIAIDAMTICVDDKRLLSRTTCTDVLVNDVDQDVRFKSVSALLCLVNVVYEYIECAGTLPPIAYDVEQKLMALLNRYNERCMELVLLAQAMKTVRLKAITAKHLALAQQSLCVVLLLLPVIHVRWFSKVITPNVLPNIEAEMKDLTERLEQHSNEIFKKLISIMEQLIHAQFERYDAFIVKCTAADSEVNNCKLKVHPSMSSLMNECKKMHRLISTYMQPYQIGAIFEPIVMLFEMKIVALLDKVKKMNAENNSMVGNADEEKEKENEKDRKDTTQAFHSLNMSIKFISDKLNRLNCDAHHLTNLCVDVD